MKIEEQTKTQTCPGTPDPVDTGRYVIFMIWLSTMTYNDPYDKANANLTGHQENMPM